MYRAFLYFKANGSVDVHHQEGHVVELRDKASQSGHALYVKTPADFVYKLGGDWHVHRWEACLRAAEQLEEVAGRLACKAAELRHQAEDARNETRPLPAEGAVFAGPGESAAGGRDETPAAQDQGLHH